MGNTKQEEEMTGFAICRAARRKLGITQAALSRLTQIDPATISKSESPRGDRGAPTNYLRMCQLVLGLLEPGIRDNFQALKPEDVIAELEKVPIAKRSVETSCFHLQAMCLQSGRLDVYQRVTGLQGRTLTLDSTSQGEVSEEFMFALVDHITEIKEQIREFRMQSDASEESRRLYDQCVVLSAQLAELLRTGIEIDAMRRQKSQGN